MRLSMGSRGGGTARSRGDTQRALDEFDELAGLRGAPGDSGSQAERSVYVLEHLATFTVTRETGIVYPADGMRRLLQLEKTNGEYTAGTRAHTAACPRRLSGSAWPRTDAGSLLTGIWSQKMQLCLEGSWVLVMDYETGVSSICLFGLYIVFIAVTNFHGMYTERSRVFYHSSR